MGQRLGTPISGNLINCTGYTITNSSFTSANLRSALTDETGSGAAVFATSPTITTPNIVGTATNDSAAAGSVGEYQETVINSGSAVSLTSGATANLITLSLTAGDWDCWGSVVFLPAAGTTTSEYHIVITTTSGSLTFSSSAHALHVAVPASQAGIIPTGIQRVSLSATTNVYLVTTQTFAVSTMTAYGFLCARRAR